MSPPQREQAGAPEQSGAATGALDAERLRHLIVVGRGVLAAIDEERVLDRLLACAQELTDARYAALGVVAEDRRSLARFLTRGVDGETRAAIGRQPEGRGLLGLLIRKPQLLRLEDLRSHPDSVGFPPGHPPMRSFLGVPIMIGSRAWGSIYVTEARKGSFDQGDEEALLVLAGWAAIAIEHARLRTTLARRGSELERTLESLRAAEAMNTALSDRSELHQILELALRRTQVLLGVASVVVMVREGEELHVAASAGAQAPSEGTRLALEGTLAGAILAGGRTEVVSDLQELPVAVRETLCTRGARSALFAPMLYRGEQVGIICAFDQRPGRWREEEEERLPSAFVASTATAIALARSFEAQRLAATLAATERERARWGRELHDQTLQALAAMRFTLKGALARAELETWQSAAGELIAQIEREIANLRAIIADLRPPVLDHGGLEEAIRSLVLHHYGEGGLHVSCALQSLPRLSPELETTLYRIAQEALTNVVRHAHAKSAEVVLRKCAGRVVLEVVDDGRGFDTRSVSGGFGLDGIRERVALVRGALSIHSGAEGTRVIVEVPLPDAPTPAELRGGHPAVLGATPK
ncbi:MAG TPA: GAF domain-containing sensor histidine kinase [Solirubrobacteraceae bacterium]|nr:GAF domain-containing sensor histidine kinase [Solirubrobacteraceae bacterium]